MDAFGKKVWTETGTTIHNVLVMPAAADDITTDLSLFGKKAVYTLGIPKDDTHDWKDAKVEFFGQTWRTFGFPTKGIDDLVPGPWNAKVKVEAYG